MGNQRGFSLIEMTVAMAVMLGITAGVFAIVNPSQGMFQTQTEVSDMQQRLRVASDTLYKDLVMAGGGSYQGKMSGSLLYTFAPVVPYRLGEINDDPPGTFKTDTLTVIYIPPTNAQTTLANNPGNSLTNSVETRVAAQAGCPSGDALCGFSEGMTVLIYDENGHSETFTITQIQDVNQNNIKIQHNGEKLTYPFPMNPSTKIVQANSYTYFLKADATTSTYQLMRYDGGNAADVPVVDNVVGLSFRYFADPQPPQLNGHPLSDKTVPVTTYGPRPPVTGQNNGDGWPDGENCVFMFAGPQLVPRLPVIGNGTTLVELTAADLSDGPWCPGSAAGATPSSWDADLLRIRKIQITLRVQSAVAALRGPASALFTYGGTSKEGTKWVPDQQMSFAVSPRNLNLGR
jgi:prepilin-type N-terminal cleavage/methylation domain-containing protein